MVCACTPYVQGLTLVHFSAQPEPFLTQIYPKHPRRPLNSPQNTPSTIPKIASCITQALELRRKVDECKPLPAWHPP